MQLPLTGTKGRKDYKGDDGEGGEYEGPGEGPEHVEVLVPRVKDVDRQRLGLTGDVARHDEDRAKLTEGARDRERHAVEDTPADRRQRHLPEGSKGSGAQGA